LLLSKLACEATPGIQKSAAQFYLVLHAWMKWQQLEETVSDVAANEFTLLSGLSGDQIRTLDVHPDRSRRRALKRLLIALLGDAETQCRNSFIRSRLSASHFESFRGELSIHSDASRSRALFRPRHVQYSARCQEDTAPQLPEQLVSALVARMKY
jgi:hypothetical protein